MGGRDDPAAAWGARSETAQTSLRRSTAPLRGVIKKRLDTWFLLRQAETQRSGRPRGGEDSPFEKKREEK